MSHVRIVMSGHGKGELFLDGKKLDKVKAFAFSGAADEVNLLEIMLISDTVEIEGEAELRVNEPLRGFGFGATT